MDEMDRKTLLETKSFKKYWTDEGTDGQMDGRTGNTKTGRQRELKSRSAPKNENLSIRFLFISWKLFIAFYYQS